MTSRILPGTDPQAIEQAAQALKQGKLVAIPTETVYGLGADADQDTACHAIFTAKGRPTDHPLIVHISQLEAAKHYAQELPEFALKLIEAYWPGPLTLILQRKPGIADAAAGHQKTIGLRCPSHPVAQALLKAFETLGGHGIAAPSANRFGRTSPTTAQHVQDAFADLSPSPIALILDGGASDVGIESTIVDCSRGKPVLLRPGIYTPPELEATAGVPLIIHADVHVDDPKAPGTLSAHYAPKAKVRLMAAEDLKIAAGMLAAASPANNARIGIYAQHLPKVKKTAHIVLRQMPGNAKDAAHELFSALHDFDAQGVSLLWVETPPDGPEWIGVRDRLQRAASS